MQRLLRLFLLIAMLVDATLARACSYERLSVEQLYAKASTVFVAHIVRAEEARGVSPLSVEPEPIVEATFRVVEILKGQPPADGKVKSLPWNRGCSVFLFPAFDFLIFLHGDDYVLMPGGSRPIILEGAESVTAETRSLLQRLRSLSNQAK
jgi:hypothetical protein